MSHLDKVDVEKVLLVARRSVAAVGEKFGDGRHGGYITSMTPDFDHLLNEPIGKIDPKKAEKYRHLSAEKSSRVLHHPRYVSSWQTRRPDNEQYGGGILLVNRHALSFSGFPEAVDEVFCMSIARLLHYIGEKRVNEILYWSNNRDLYKQVHEVVIFNATIFGQSYNF